MTDVPIINSQLDETNLILRGIRGDLDIMAARDRADILTDYATIGHIVGAGNASALFNYGDQLATKWTDKGAQGEPEYDNPLDICRMGTRLLQNGETINTVTVAQHYATNHGIPFDPRQAAFAFVAPGAADTFNFLMTNQPWYAGDVGKHFKFTLTTQTIPVGAQLVFTNSYNATVEGTKIQLFADGTSTTPLEEATISVGEGGTYLGELTSAGIDETTGVNSIQCALLGYNRWSTSVYRQYLNSSGLNWYAPKTIFSRPPDSATLALPGYMSGFDEEFLSIVNPTRVRTALNHVTDTGIGEYEDTYDFFYLPSLQEIYTIPQVPSVDEGEPFEYYKRALGLTTPSQHYPSVYDAYKIGSITNHTVPVYCRLRSAYVSSAYYTWYVDTSGYVNYSYANYSYRSTPVCEISSNWP